MDHTNILDGSNKWPTRFGTMPGMAQAAPSDADLRELRLRYNAAYSAYQGSVIALNTSAMTGQAASLELLANEAAALRELTETRAALLAAMAAAVGSDRSKT
jgi:hypothetical protein